MKYPFLLSLFIPLMGVCNSNPEKHITNDGVVKQTVATAADPSTWHGVSYPLAIDAGNKNELTEADFKYAADAGANVIRLAVSADQEHARAYVSFFGNDGSLIPLNSNPAIASLKKAIGLAAAANIKVIIDMHTSPGVKTGKIWSDEHYWDELVQMWTLVAREFKDNNTVIAFDLMNEPHILEYIRKQSLIQKTGDEARMYLGTWSPPQDWKNTPRDYSWNISKLIKAIRSIDPNRCVVVEGFGILGNPVNFNWMQPIQGFTNVVYSFHMYIPTGLTNLGAKGSIRKGKDQDIAPFTLANDESKIDKAFAPVIAFQKKYHVPVFVGEFGITTRAIFGKNDSGQSFNGACWLSTVIKKMNENKWGWTYWNFWTPIRKPQSDDDPRYIILSAAMHGKPIPDYCR